MEARAQTAVSADECALISEGLGLLMDYPEADPAVPILIARFERMARELRECRPDAVALGEDSISRFGANHP